MYMALDISDWKLKVFEKRKLESLRYFRIWKPELGYYRIFITALLLNWFWTPSFLSVLDNCRLILPPTLFRVMLTFWSFVVCFFSLLMFSPFVETLKTPFNRKWRRRHFRELGKCICVDAALHKEIHCTKENWLFPGKKIRKTGNSIPGQFTWAKNRVSQVPTLQTVLSDFLWGKN